ncbi:Hok/Gef family protein [Salmonella enterica]|nr:Hok/Gef family protein [Salmonella enterica]
MWTVYSRKPLEIFLSNSLCVLRLQQGNTVLVATLAYEVKR